MFRRLFTAPRRTPPEVLEEIAALCNAASLARPSVLSGSANDEVDLDCGCLPATDVRVGPYGPR